MSSPVSINASAPWRAELQDILCGAAGGFLFGIPLIYTVEVWAIGSATAPPRLLAALVITFVVVLLLTQIEGFRQNLTPRPLEAVMESVEALGIGITCAAIALVLLRRITLETPLAEILGKLIFEGVPFALGVALARSTLSRNRRDRPRRIPMTTVPLDPLNLREALADLDATLIGSVLIGFSIAPTEEIPLIAASMPPLWLLLIMAASLSLSYVIVFAAGFTNRTARQQRGLLLSPLTETLFAYLVALLASLVMLIFFQQLNIHDPWPEWLGDVIVLGLPVAIGGAAGRILV